MDGGAQLVNISRGFDDAERSRVARLFWEAFSGKLGRLMRPEAKALHFISDALNPGYALAARDDAGALLGIIGFKTSKGGLVGGTFGDLTASYGWLGAAWRGPLLNLLERDLAPGQLLLDGIFVTEAARGQGAGTALIDAVIEFARAEEFSAIRLDVIDTNPRARALYERCGFRAVGVSHTGPLKWLFGFGSATEMHLTVMPDV